MNENKKMIKEYEKKNEEIKESEGNNDRRKCIICNVYVYVYVYVNVYVPITNGINQTN